MQYYDQYGQPTAVPKPSTNWSSVVIGLASLVLGIISLKSNEFEWLLYFCGPALFVCILLMLWNTRLSSYIIKKYTSRKDLRLLKKELPAYKELVKEAEVAEKLFKAVSSLKWPRSIQLPIYRSPEGYIRRLLSVSVNFKGNSAITFLHINDSLNRHLDYIDSYLNQNDHFIVHRKVEFTHEGEKTNLHKTIREYEAFLSRNTKFCNDLNTKLSPVNRINDFYGSDLCYSPTELKPDRKVVHKELDTATNVTPNR